jgi:hypothetical protein
MAVRTGQPEPLIQCRNDQIRKKKRAALSDAWLDAA